jgi:transposase-like protein
VWLYHRFPLSSREIEELMMACGVLVTYETLHQGERDTARRGRERHDLGEAGSVVAVVSLVSDLWEGC